MINVWQFDQAAANNNAAPPHGAPEGMARSAVNDTIRELYAAIARWRDDLAGVTLANVVLTSTGTANAQALSTNQQPSSEVPHGFMVTFRVGTGLTNTGPATLNLDGIGAKAIQLVSGAPLVGGELQEGATITVIFHQPANAFVLLNGLSPLAFLRESTLTTRGDLIRRGESASERLPLGPAGKVVMSDGTDAVFDHAVVPGYIAGLTLSNNGADPTNDIDVATGLACDRTNVSMIALTAAMTKRLDASWAAGNDQGGLDDGTIADTTYHVHLIKRPDTGAVDVLFSTSATAPTMPTNYTLRRRIGSFLRSGGSIRLFWQEGDVFQLRTLSAQETLTASAGWGLITLAAVPAGIMVQPILTGTVQEVEASATSTYNVGDARDTGETSPVNLGRVTGALDAQAFAVTGGFFTNTSGQIRRSFSEGGNAQAILRVRGWIDSRGKDG